MDQKRRGVFSDLQNSVSENVILWWRYAFECLRRDQRERKNGTHEFEVSPQAKVRYEKEFILLFAKYSQNLQMTEEEKANFDYLLLISKESELKSYLIQNTNLF